MKKLFVLLSLFAIAICPVLAQTDFGMFYELGVEKKLTPGWELGLDADFRTRDDASTADRWSVGVSTDYRLLKVGSKRKNFALKAALAYTLLYDNNPEKLTLRKNGMPKKWTPSYWGIRHRFSVALAGSFNVGQWGLSLRERYQLTCRPEKEGQRYALQYDDDDYLIGHALEAVKSKTKGMLRSRFAVDYNIRNCKVDPFASVEMFSDNYGIQKMRYQVGIDYKLSKKHQFSLTYRFQDVGSDDDDNDVNSHIIGLSYKLKL